MFEARLTQGGVLIKLSDVLKDYVDYDRVSSFDCSADSLGLQALDSAHVTLVSVMLRSEGFDHYRCDRPVRLGMNMYDLAAVLKCANDNDVVTLKARPSPPRLARGAVHLSVPTHAATAPSADAPSAAPGS